MRIIAMVFRKIEKDKRGFTLVELLAVLSVLAIIAAIAVPRFTGTISAAKKSADKASAQIIARAAEQKYLDDQSTGYQTYVVKSDTNIQNNLVPDYLKEVPKAQNSSETTWSAKVEDGKCTGVYYGDSASGTNLLQ
ncbi:MAG: type II secretion system GspH family protein [Tepidanaerobacteraceae bacterium]|nr:type II secretion system GspH family protein [Tepidanaerobacteraceae bacterium]